MKARLNSGDFTRAIEHARRQVAHWETREGCQGQVKSAELILAAMELVRAWGHEAQVIARANMMRLGCDAAQDGQEIVGARSPLRPL